MKISPVPAPDSAASWQCNASGQAGKERRSGSLAPFRHLSKGKCVVLAMVMAVTGFAALVLASTSLRYTARSAVLIGMRTAPAGLSSPAGEQGAAPGGFQARMEAEIRSIQSDRIAGELIERLHLASDPEFNAALASPMPKWTTDRLRGWILSMKEQVWPAARVEGDQKADIARVLRRHISVETLDGAGALGISAWSASPEKATDLANTLAELYVRTALDEKVAAIGHALAALRKRLDVLQSSVEVSGRAVVQSRMVAGLPAREESGALKTGSQGALDPSTGVLSPPPVQNLREQEVALEREGREWRARTPESIEASMERHISSGALRHNVDEGNGKVASSLLMELRAAADRSRLLRRELMTLEQQLGKPQQSAVDLHNSDQETSTTRYSHDRLSLEHPAGTQNHGSRQPDAQILSRAENSQAFSSLAKLLQFGFTGLASTAALGFFLAVAGIIRTTKVGSPMRQESSRRASRKAAGMTRMARTSSTTEGASTSADPDPDRLALGQAFTPTQPQQSAVRFVGRREQLARIQQAIIEEQAHVCLYGERGRGKTSLVNLAAEAGRIAGFTVARYSCTAESDFDGILRGLARNLPRGLLVSSLRRVSDLMGCEAALPPGPLQPWHVLALLGRLVECRLILVVDEFDRLPDDATRTHLADTIKLLSEHAAPIFFVIVGVAGSLEHLLSRHPSVQRNVIGVPLPLMTDAEIEEIVLRGAQHAGLDFPAQVRACIAALARGVPYHAQLLALRAGQEALSRGHTAIAAAELQCGIEQIIAEADPRITTLYEDLTQGERDNAVVSLLRSLAAGEQDRFGRFRATCTPEGQIIVAGALTEPALWMRLLDAGVVRPCVGDGAGIYAFGEPALPHYVLLRIVRLVLAFGTGR